MKYPVHNTSGERVKEVELNSGIFSVEVNEGLVHQVATAQLANRRNAIAHTKDRGEVSGGGKKPWKQKGTGRARHGSNRSPIWVGGGVTFGPRSDRNFSQKINKKMARKALFMCLSDRIADKQVVLLDKFEIKDNKTKEFITLLTSLKDVLGLELKTKKTTKSDEDKKEVKKTTSKKKFDIKDYKTSVLVVVPGAAGIISRTARNIPGIRIISALALNVVDILSHKNLLILEDSLPVIADTYLSSGDKSTKKVAIKAEKVEVEKVEEKEGKK